MQSFSLSNSLIKKLYSASDAPAESSTSGDGAPQNGRRNNRLGEVNSSTELSQVSVQKEIDSRSTFSYKYPRWWVLWRFDNSYCLCCRAKKKREDFLFKDAKAKLNEETDILEILKKLRVSHFMSEITLEPHQRDLINFFQDYKIKEPNAPESAIQHSVLAARQPAPSIQSVDEQLLNSSTDKAISRLYESIQTLNPRDETDAKIIAKITNA